MSASYRKRLREIADLESVNASLRHDALVLAIAVRDVGGPGCSALDATECGCRACSAARRILGIKRARTRRRRVAA